MSEQEAEGQTLDEKTAGDKTADLALEYALDAPPEKVWRAISLPAFRQAWLPKQDLLDEEPISSEPGEAISYRMKDDLPPFLESEVTFQVRPDGDGGTILRVLQVLADERVLQQTLRAANNNQPVMMRAA